MVNFDLLKGTGAATQVANNVAQGQVDMRVGDSMAALQQRMQDPDFNLAASSDFATIMKDKPELANNLIKQFREIGATDQQSYINDFVSIRDDVKRGDMDSARKRLEGRIMKLQENGRDPVDSIRALKILEEDPNAFVENVNSMLNARAQFDDSQLGGLGGEAPAQVKNYKFFNSVLQDPNSTEEQKKAARIALKLEAPPSSALWAELIRDPDKLKTYIEGKKGEAEGREQGKLDVQARMLPNIRSAVSAAEKAAKDAGQEMSDYIRYQAAMPIFEESYNQLKLLAPQATFTLAGKAADALAREMFGVALDGATASARFDSLVNNVVLPQLKPTFGGAISDAELQELKKTIAAQGTPEEKMASLDSWISMKKLEMESKRAGAGAMQQEAQNKAGGLQNTTNDDDLINKYLEP